MATQAPTMLDLPPGPKQPRYAQALQWVMRPQEFVVRQRERFGDVFTLEFIDGQPLVVLSDPEDVRTVFTGSAEVMHAGEANKLLAPILGSRSILLLDEAEHLRHRRLLLPPFHGERMLRYEQIMAEATRRELATWQEGETIEMLPRMQAITLEVIMRAVFGIEDGLGKERLRVLLRTMLQQTTNMRQMALSLILGPDSERLQQRLDEVLSPVDEELYRVIAEHRCAPDLEEREDILSMLLLARDEDGQPLSDEELRDELMTLLLAGHETTASSLSWAFEQLTQKPQTLERLTEELRGGDDEAYVDAVIQETMRLRPVLPIVIRVLKEPITVGQGRFRLPAGTRVAPAIILVHLRDDIYPEPFEFRPERFIETPPGTYTWIPFGGGMRRCVGSAFALFEMRAVLRAVLTTFDIEAAGGPERITRRSLTIVPDHGGRVRVVRRAEVAGAGAADQGALAL
ncbi:MAG: cytochrome P450 [Solirubrobacteraceae bacterium]|nr:cytochrome P450 [Solirubrobacteraceae bacterium]MDP4672035.1 cytochrome P450 [Solirubrobacteraceae bacterium]MDP4921025.1 cytochrome P450 [Solirubrobacteraceae bacterium]